MSVPHYAAAMISHWRVIANIPDDISDEEIFIVLDRDRPSVTSGQTEEENRLEIDFVRDQLGLA